MTIVFAAKLEGRNALLADIFVTDAPGQYSIVEKVFPCSWVADTYFAGLGDELLALILRGQIGDGPKQFGWAPLSSIDLNSPTSMDALAGMATDYRRLLRKCNHPPVQDSSTLYVADRVSVKRWRFKASADDTYRLTSRTAETVPEGYSFLDSGWERPPVVVLPTTARAQMNELVAFVGSRASELPYIVGASITGVLIPHSVGERPQCRCLCELTIDERTSSPREGA